MPRLLLPAAVALAALVLSSCESRPRETPARRTARLNACIAEELLIQARGRVASLDTLLAQAEPESPATLLARPGHVFATAVLAHAERRHRQTAYQDSAASARSREDSTRHAGQARGFRTPPLPQGSVAANAAERYERDFLEARANPDHPCNQRSRAEERR